MDHGKSGILTWIKYRRPFQVRVLLRTQIQTPELFETGPEFADSSHGGLLPLGPRALLTVQENPFQHAVCRAVRHLEVHPLLSQTQNKERRPAAPEKRELVVGGHLVESGQVLHELDGFDQNRRCFLAHLRGASQADCPSLFAAASVRR